MKYGYTIVYVESFEKTLEFYKNVFGFAARFLHESKDYGELAFERDAPKAARPPTLRWASSGFSVPAIFSSLLARP